MKNFCEEFIKYNENHSDAEKNILIPALQRDYVQGGRDYIIDAFLNQLLAALKGEIQIDLNYLYGSMEKDKGFVPIDGQQRLITLWLLHLYIYTKNGKNFPVELGFATREFANEFSAKLKDNLKNYIKSKDLVKDIIDSPWFVIGWQYDITVANMLKTLDYISQKVDDSSDYSKYENITFSFLDMEEKGLTDEIYVKMNGRGRPLSYFENLKSWMDEQVSKKSESKSNEEENWQIKMDNKWTDFFWKNRNKNQVHPEEIDDEQLRLFYTLILLYWIQEENNYSQIIEKLFEDKSEDKMSEKISDKDLLIAYLGFDKKDFSYDEVQKKLFNSLREGKQLIPLYWIEKLHLFESGTFDFIEKALDNLCEIDTNNLLNLELKLFLNDEKEKVSYMYQIAMETATYEKTIPYLFVLVNTPQKYREAGNKNFEQWIRIFRNLIENTTITRDNISKICACIRSIAEIAEESDKAFYNAIVDAKNKYDVLEGFLKTQLSEEYQKAARIIENHEWEDAIKNAENHVLLKGKISVLFQNKEETSIDSFKTRLDLLNKLLGNADKYHIVKVMLSYLGNKDVPEYPHCLKLHKTNEFWKALITDNLFAEFQSIPDSGEKKQLDSDSWLGKLVNTQVLNNCRYQALTKYDERHVLWGTEGLGGTAYGCVVLDYKRDDILHELENKGLITVENKKVNETNYWEEWNRIFTITETSTTYVWEYNNFIYKVDKNKNRIPRANPGNTPNETDKYYCIKCQSQLNIDNFIETLKNL